MISAQPVHVGLSLFVRHSSRFVQYNQRFSCFAGFATYILRVACCIIAISSHEFIYKETKKRLH